MYAADRTLATPLQASHPGTCNCGTINNELVNIISLVKVNELSLNVSKYNFTGFHHIQKQINLPAIIINNGIVKYVDSLNFLGILLDEHISWKVTWLKFQI